MAISRPQPGTASSSDVATPPLVVEDNISAPTVNGISDEEIERLGRQRPAVFSSWWHEWCFCGSILGSMLMAEFFISGFIIVLPNVSQTLQMPPGTQTWPASVFGLVTGALLFAFGRVADMHGGRTIYLFGMFWYTLWILIAGFSNNHVTLIIARAMQGIGPAAFLPSGVMLLGSTYRPGPRKNMVFSIYGSFAPIGFFMGTLAGGALAEFLDWRWYFWIGAIILFAISVASFFAIPKQPKDQPRPKDDGKDELKMDWLGVATIPPGLLLVVFAVTQGAHTPQGFATPYIYVTLVLGVLLLCAAVYVEGWVAKQPLVPFDLFAPKYMTPMVIGLFHIYGSFGIFQFYASFYIQQVIGHSPLLAAAWFCPLAVGGTILAVVGGIVLHRLPSHLLLIFSAAGSLASTLLFALIPADPAAVNYWAWVFTAMIGGTVGIDVSFNVSSVFMTTALPGHRQGLAGALINTLVFLGIGFYLGVADLIVVTARGNTSEDKADGFRVAFWLGVGCSATALVIATLFTRIGRMKSDLTYDEKMELEAEAARLRSVSGPGSGQDTSSGRGGVVAMKDNMPA